MYILYFYKSEKKLKLQKSPKHMLNLPYEEEIKQYNDCMYICTTRKPLKELALRLKQEWIEELEQQLEELKTHKI